MKPLQFDEFVLIAAGHTAFQLLCAGVELGVFERLAERPGLSQAELARALGLRSRPITVLCNGLRALRLLEGDDEGYRNAAIVDELCVRDRPGNLVDMLGWQRHIVYPGEVDLVESLQRDTNVGLRRFPGTEDDLYQRLAHDPKLEAVFHAAMSSLSNTANRLLAGLPAWAGASCVMDAGGGDGTNAVTLAQTHPKLEVTVFEVPSVAQKARDNAKRAGLEHRVHVTSGDLFTDPFPQVDTILFAHMMTIWSRDKDVELLRKAHDSLPPGGRVVIFNMMADDDGPGPMTAALGSPYFLSIATGEGMLRPSAEYESYLREAGFELTDRVELPRDHGAIVATKASI